MHVDEYLQQLQPPVREIATELCTLIRQHPRQLKEAIKWKVPVFSDRRNVCSVIAHTSHVNLQFFHGAHIADSGALEGTGKDMRHVKFTNVKDIRREAVFRYLDQAIALDQAT